MSKVTFDEAKEIVGTPSYFGVGVFDAQKRLDDICPDGYRIVIAFRNATKREDDLVALGYAARIGAVKVRSGDQSFPIYLCDDDALKRPPGRPAELENPTRLTVRLSETQLAKAKTLGNGEPSVGVRLALDLAKE